jgi:hypothetical protein
MHEGIKGQYNLHNILYDSAQNLLPAPLLSKNVKMEMYEATIFPSVFYVSETWSLTIREEHIWGLFENRVLSRICMPKRDEIIGNCRKLHNEEFNNLNFLPHDIRMIKSRSMKSSGHVSYMEE